MLERTTQPQTLIEKLEQEVNRLLELKAQEKPHSLGYVFLGHHIAATVNAINIVKQHQDESGWIACSERMPEDEQEVLWWNEAYQCLVIGEWRENRELVFYRNGDYADVSEFFYWQCLPKPLSEVQDD